MCQDLFESSHWTRLPTELILMFISRIFNLNITIINDSDFEHSINLADDQSKKIYLAHLGETHYLPIDSIQDSPKDLNYTEGFKRFHKWAQMQIKKIEDHDKENKENKEVKSENTGIFRELDVNTEFLNL